MLNELATQWKTPQALHSPHPSGLHPKEPSAAARQGKSLASALQPSPSVHVPKGAPANDVQQLKSLRLHWRSLPGPLLDRATGTCSSHSSCLPLIPRHLSRSSSRARGACCSCFLHAV